MKLLAQAGPETSELAMVAVYPRLEEAERLVVEGGLEASDLHCTLVFLGEAADVDGDLVTEAAALVASELVPLAGMVGGLGRFAEGEDGIPVILLPDVQGLTLLRERIVDELGHRGIRSPSEHGFLPHMTVTWVEGLDGAAPDEMPQPLEALGHELHFDALSVVIGGQRTDYELTGARVASSQPPPSPGLRSRAMPWHIERDHAECGEGKPFAVVKDDDGALEGCHETREQAEEQLSALYASEDTDEDAIAADATVIVVGEQETESAADGRSRPFEAELVPEGVATDDGRFMALGSLSWRDPPLTLLVLDENTEGGHLGAIACGHIDDLAKRGTSATSAMVSGMGEMDSGELGQETGRRVDEGTLGGVSVDLAIREWGARDPETGEIIASDDLEEDEWMALFMGSLQFAVLDGVIGAATIVPFPAFADARIAMLASGELVRVEDALVASSRIPGLVEVGGELHLFVEAPFSLSPPAELTACAAGPLRPPTEWFENPKLSAPTPLTVTPEGRVYGHVASWDCHTGYADRCLRASPSQNGYAHFHTGKLETDSGDLVRVGRITVKPHAPRGASMAAVSAHYDDVRRVAAYGRCYDDAHGIAFAGVTRSDASPELLRDFLANPPSGDWRRHELLGISSVPVPGLPVVSPEARIIASADGEVEVEALFLPPVLAASAAASAPLDEAAETAANETVQALAEHFEEGFEAATGELAASFR